MAESTGRIARLDELSDFKVADGDPDVRGWDVLGMDNRKVGEVDGLLVDTAAMKVRYLDVEIDDAPAGHNGHILVPIGYARLLEKDERIQVDRLKSVDIAALPAYSHQALTRDYETDLQGRFTGTDRTTPPAGDFYAHESYDDSRFFGGDRAPGRADSDRMTLSEEELAVGKREQVAGAVEIDKEIETRHVHENVPVKHEEVIVERQPARPGASAHARIEEGEIRVPVTEEELVVDKRTVPREELVVRKEEVVEERTVEADLRRERAEVRAEGDVEVRDDRR